jgi:DNA-binding transcriptional LysR family regulator
MDRLEAMGILLAVVDAGSFSAAARKLGVPLATVSRKVSMLEEELATRLLLRTTRRLSATDAGRAYVAACRRILDQVADAERAVTGEYGSPKGELVVAAPIVFGRLHVLPVVVEFMQRFPDIDVRLVLSDRRVNLFEGDADVAIRIGELTDSSLIARRIGSVGRVTCGSPSYFARRGTPRRPEDVSKHDCITFDAVASPDRWTFRVGKKDKSVRVRSRLTVSTAEAAVDAAAVGTGMTRVFSYQTASAERSGALVRVLRKFEPAALPVHVVHVGALLPSKVRAFLDFASGRLAGSLTSS